MAQSSDGRGLVGGTEDSQPIGAQGHPQKGRVEADGATDRSAPLFLLPTHCAGVRGWIRVRRFTLHER